MYIHNEILQRYLIPPTKYKRQTLQVGLDFQQFYEKDTTQLKTWKHNMDGPYTTYHRKHPKQCSNIWKIDSTYRKIGTTYM